jgi:hypothetical protein
MVIYLYSPILLETWKITSVIPIHSCSRWILRAWNIFDKKDKKSARKS